MTDTNHNRSNSQGSVIDLATVSLKESLAELFRRWEAAAHRPDEDPEHVHQLRIASRRATAALGLFADFLPRRKTEQLLRELDALRKSAGPARDCDVFAKRISSIAGESASILLADHLRKQRAEAQETLVTHFEKCDQGEALERRATQLLGALRPRRHGSKTHEMPVERWASRKLRSAVRQFFADSKVDTECLDRLHQFRIRAKQFRYVLELLQPSLPADRFKKAYSGLKKLSQRLGEINDHATAVETIDRCLSSDFDPEFNRELRRGRKTERSALRDALDQFDDWWSPRRQRQLRRRLKRLARVEDRASLAE